MNQKLISFLVWLGFDAGLLAIPTALAYLSVSVVLGPGVGFIASLCAFVLTFKLLEPYSVILFKMLKLVIE